MSGMELPEGWAMTKLEMLATDVSYGYTASSTDAAVGPKMLRITDIQDNAVNWTDVPYCLIEEEKKAKYLLRKNDLVFARTGATVGKSFLIKNEPPEAVYASYLIRVRTASDSLISLLSYFFNSQQYWTQITEFSAGIGQPNVNGTKLKDLDIPLPPLAEQKVIAEKLDTLLAQVETTKTHLERIPEILKTFRQSILAAAVSGKLTEEWRGESSLDEVTNLPSGWRINTANEICLKVQSGSTPRGNPFDQNGNIPFLKVYNIVDQKINFDYKPQFVTLETHQKSLKRSIAFPNDILMNIVGPPLGKVAVLTDQYPEWNLNQAITFFRADPELLKFKYLYYVLCEGALVRDVMPETKGSVGQVNISLTQCRESLIPLPPLGEQTEIVRRVEELFTFADSIEQKANAALERVNNLTQSILAKAFRGELTAQWRSENQDLITGDNSAEALLEKIKAEREAVVPKKKARTKKRA